MTEFIMERMSLKAKSKSCHKGERDQKKGLKKQLNGKLSVDLHYEP